MERRNSAVCNNSGSFDSFKQSGTAVKRLCSIMLQGRFLSKYKQKMFSQYSLSYISSDNKPSERSQHMYDKDDGPGDNTFLVYL
ncbi:hypothetical protein MHH60_11180 [Paenibacillus sp. FSL H7-0716]|uniref:hypothetical protein n=1 Tax=Paenibacillus TaxID=44249 RepID=UPI00118056EF|nr:hypothetical protein [Paenibacillus odorifer]